MQERKLTIPGLFREVVIKSPGKTALQIKRNNSWFRVTYKELEERSLRIAAFLIKQRFNKGESAAIILENRPEWAMIYLGIASAGLVCVPIDPQLSRQEINNLVGDSNAKAIFCSYDIFTKKIKQGIAGNTAKIIVLDFFEQNSDTLTRFADIETGPSEINTFPEISPQDIASLIYTSGTTAEPKGVLLSHANICSNYNSIRMLGLASSSDNALSILPLHHTYAFMVTLITPVFLGATATYCTSFNSQELIDTIREGGVTIVVGVPQLFLMLHRAISERVKKIPFLLSPLSLLLVRSAVRRQWGRNLRLMVSGGARLDPEVARDLSRLLGIKIIEGYGLTETSPVVSLNPVEKIKFGSVGKPIPDVEVKIINPDAKGVGEVLIKGPNVMQGYFKHPEWTGAVIKDGWFHSGDLGYIDSEGYIFISGRENEIIVLSSGKNIYPEELEEHYGRSPYIKEICILAMQIERFGRMIDTLHAVVVPNLEYFKQKNETDIRSKIRWEIENLGNTLPSYRHIMGFTLTREDLPRTALRKIRRYYKCGIFRAHTKPGYFSFKSC